ncbi:hypothetical protein RCOM_1616350 [Ricinus communis]|uniref:Uncharacterized protein n=1 Tax=Ricinus communis TaxID=3988 RepID=B9RDX0_RICCO|nr:hypothetical protein RCOM_1616350 [Ricinus communis]
MPPFEVQDDTERVLRNFMAYEQCHHPNDHYICDFIWILDFLITAGKDVEVLVQNGIVVNLVGNNIAVAELVNKLGLEITASGACFHELSIELNSHCMRRVYFTNLWRGTGTVAALFLLLLTLAQSIYSIMQIFQHSLIIAPDFCPFKFSFQQHAVTDALSLHSMFDAN